MSSYLSKSKKDFKPKAPTRRSNAGGGHGAANSSQSSVRASAERQIPTPQTQLTFINSSPAVQSQGVSASPGPRIVEEVTPDVDGSRAPSESQIQRISTGAEDNHTANCQSSDPIVVQADQDEPSTSLPHQGTRRGRGQVNEQEITTAPQRAPVATISREPAGQSSGDLGRDFTQPPAKRQKTSTSSPARAIINPPGPVNGEPTTASSVSAAELAQVSPTTNSRPGPPSSLRRNELADDPPAATNILPTQESVSNSTAQSHKERSETRPKGTRGKGIKRSHKKRTTEASVDAATEEDGLTAAAGKADSSKKGRKGRRAETPENAESVQISEDVVTMSELTKDLRQGKKSSRESRLRERDLADLARRQELAEAEARQQSEAIVENTGSGSNHIASVQPGSATAVEGEPNTGRTNEAARSSEATATRAPATTRAAPRVRLVNGQIVQDEESRMIDRHGVAAALRSSEDDVRVEDELTRHINAGSYMKREVHNKWTAQTTEVFYIGLRMFGTDFMTISKMLPGRSRRQIKLKFNKEERNDKEKIQRALLLERRPADLLEFERMAGEEFPDPALLEEKMRGDRTRLEEEQRKEIEAMEELVRQREREVAAEDGTLRSGTEGNTAGSPSLNSDGGAGSASAKENESTPLDDGADQVAKLKNDTGRQRGRRVTRQADTQKPKGGGQKLSQPPISTVKTRSGIGTRSTK